MLVEKNSGEKKAVSFRFLQFLEISGLCCGVLLPILGSLGIFDFLQPFVLLIPPKVRIILSSCGYVLLSLAAVVIHNRFCKLFFTGTQFFILGKSVYCFLTTGFNQMMLQGFWGNRAAILTIIALIVFLCAKYIYFHILALKVMQVPGNFAISRFPADEQFAGKFNDRPELFFSTTRTPQELSVITESKIFLKDYPLYDNLVLFEFTKTRMDGAAQASFAKVLKALDSVHIAYFPVCTFDKNYLLFKSESILLAKYIWNIFGIKVQLAHKP